MSGRTKRILYRFFTVILLFVAYAGAVLMLYVANGASFQLPSASLQIVWWCFLCVDILFPLSILIHEVGHLLFGWISGMKFVSVTVCWAGLFRSGKKFRFAPRFRYAGATQMFPKNGRHVRDRVSAFTLGGAAFNLIYGAVFLVLFFLLPHYPALLFFELFAPLNLMEGLTALYPVELSEGKTDGAVLLGLIRKESGEEVMLRVFQAQGILNEGSFSDIPRELLFEAPVIREDDAAFCALTQLREQYLFWADDREGALRECGRLESLMVYLSKDVEAEVACDLVYAYAENGYAEKARLYFSKAETAPKTCAYWRAQAAMQKLNGQIGAETEKAYALAEKLPMKGIREYEKKLLCSLKTEK